MIFFQVILFVEILGSVSCVCKFVLWSTPSPQHTTSCDSLQIVRRVVSEPHKSFGRAMAGINCCDLPDLSYDQEKVVEFADWTVAWPDKDRWADCPSGYFISGLTRPNTLNKITANYSDIVVGRCVRPAGHPLDYKDCYVDDVNDCVAKKRTCDCRPDFLLTGLYKSRGNTVTYLDKMRCCSMLPREIQTLEDVKTTIMERTLPHMASLADHLGFSYCKGYRGAVCGEDFVRHGDNFQANSKVSDDGKNCSDPDCQKRLKIVYGNWRLKVRDVKYGVPVSQTLAADIYSNGRFTNMDSSKLIVNLNVSKFEPRTITINHTVLKSFHACPGCSPDYEFHIPLGDDDFIKYRSKLQVSDYTVAQTSAINETKVDMKKIPIFIPPKSECNYVLLVAKAKTIVSYTAVVAVEFSAEFGGYLNIHDLNDRFSPVNFHFQHNIIQSPLYFTYRFGNESVPFYAALKAESEANVKPWLWGELFKYFEKNPYNIKRLQDKSWYTFNINGSFEVFSGSKIGVIKQTLRLDESGVNVEADF